MAVALGVALIAANALAVSTTHENSIDRIDDGVSTDDSNHAIAPKRAIRGFHEPQGDVQKYIRFTGTSGWPGGIVHWRYNDSGRPAGIVASSAAAITAIQTAQAKWTAVCNVQFIYDGTSSAPPSLANPQNQVFDGFNVIGWLAQAQPQTGYTGIGWNFPEPGPTVEGDIALNNTYNPDLAVTLVHELGHLLGLNHSDVSNVVMSGPPLTAYVPVSTPQPDDIAGCRANYGPPPGSAISGTITNGGGVQGVTFCARPSAGVTCGPSNASGVYSCTVPPGWTGTLHSPIVAGNRIPAQVFSSPVNGLVTRNVTAKTDASFSCNLDIDNNGLLEPTLDGVAILRRMSGFAESSMTGLVGTCAPVTTTTATMFAVANPLNLQVTGLAPALAETDGLVLVRAMQGITGGPVTAGTGRPGATRTIWGNGVNDNQIKQWLNTTCGTDF